MEAKTDHPPAPGFPLADRFPCIFPGDQGIGARDGFALACPHRQLVWGCRDPAPAPRDPPRKRRAFAGSWERGRAEAGPETASSGPMAGNWSRLSLLRSLAVPFRWRFARAEPPRHPSGETALLGPVGKPVCIHYSSPHPFERRSDRIGSSGSLGPRVAVVKAPHAGQANNPGPTRSSTGGS
jgi:hypothetical protein